MRSGTAAALGAAIAGTALLAAVPARAQVDPGNLVPCAREGGICKMPYPTNVYFGVPGRTNGRPFPGGGAVACNTQSFGDPAPGQLKSCWYAQVARGGGGGGYGGGGYGGGGDGYRARRDDYGGRDDYRGRDDGYRQRRPDYEYAPERRRYRGDPDDY